MFWALTRRGGDVLPTVTSSTSTSASTITLPAGISAGDVIVVSDVCIVFGGTAPTLVTPSGFTNLTNGSAADGTYSMRGATCYKIADGTESSSVLTMMNSAINSRKIAAVFKYAYMTPSIANAQAQTLNVTSGNLNPQTITTTGSTGVTAAIAVYGSGLAETNTFAPTQTGSVSVSTNGQMKYLLANYGYASDVTYTVTTENSNLITMSTFYIQWT